MAANPNALLAPFESIGVVEAFNARKKYDGIGELAASIRERGLLTPLEVRKNPDGPGYLLVSGFRRHKAIASLRAETPRGKAKPFPKVAVQLFAGDEQEAYLRNLAENGGRRDLRVWELGLRCIELKERFGLDAVDIAKTMGCSKGYAYQSIKITTMAPAILTHCQRTDVPVNLLVLWSSKPHATQLKEFHSWRQKNEGKGPRGSKTNSREPQPLRLARERAVQAPILLRAIRESSKPKQWREGALAAIKWMAGRTARPPVPLSPRS